MDIKSSSAELSLHELASTMQRQAISVTAKTALPVALTPLPCTPDHPGHELISCSHLRSMCRLSAARHQTGTLGRSVRRAAGLTGSSTRDIGKLLSRLLEQEGWFGCVFRGAALHLNVVIERLRHPWSVSQGFRSSRESSCRAMTGPRALRRAGAGLHTAPSLAACQSPRWSATWHPIQRHQGRTLQQAAGKAMESWADARTESAALQKKAPFLDVPQFHSSMAQAQQEATRIVNQPPAASPSCQHSLMALWP